MWIKAGTILPILDHKRELSLLRALNNPIALQIYTNAQQTAHGFLILDDGWSTKNNKSLIELNLSQDGTLTYMSHKTSNHVTIQTVDKIVMYGIKSEPTEVKKNGKHNHEFQYDAPTETLTITNLLVGIPLTEGLEKTLITVHYSDVQTQ